MNAAETHERDQIQGQMREYATALARDAAAYRGALIAGGIPDELADTMTLHFNASWLGAHVEMQAGMGSEFSLYFGMAEDDE